MQSVIPRTEVLFPQGGCITCFNLDSVIFLSRTACLYFLLKRCFITAGTPR